MDAANTVIRPKRKEKVLEPLKDITPDEFDENYDPELVSAKESRDKKYRIEIRDPWGLVYIRPVEPKANVPIPLQSAYTTVAAAEQAITLYLSSNKGKK